MQRPYLRFPPGQGNVLVPLRPARAAATGTTLYTASRPLPLLAQRLCWLAARAGAARALPGERADWDWPLARDLAGDLVAQLQRIFGGRRIDGVAVYERPQAHRSGLTVLVCAGRDAVLARVRRDAAELALETAVSRQAATIGVRSFHVPRQRGHGTVGDADEAWHWTAYDAIARAPHAPARRLAAGMADEITQLVESVIAPPAGTPAGWRGAHGDLTPWNLRRAARGRVWLIDWEDLRFAPIGADACFFALSRAAVARGARADEIALLQSHSEAVAYWIDELTNRTTDARDVGLIERMLALATAAAGQAAGRGAP